MTVRRQWSDQDLLEMLDMRDRRGMASSAIAKEFGVSKGVVIGLLHRINAATDEHDETPELNGTMPERWWERAKEAAE